MYHRPTVRTITREEFNSNKKPPKRQKRKCISPLQRPRLEPEEYKKLKECEFDLNKLEMKEVEEKEKEDWENESEPEEETFEGNYEDN